MAVRSVLGLALAAGTALAAHRLAVLNASTNVLDYAGADDDAPFVTVDTVTAAGAIQSVLRLGDGTTHKVTASKAISRGAVLYAAASGKVTDAPNGKPRGIALAAASGDGSVIEMVPLPCAVEAQGIETLADAAATLTVAQLGKLLLMPNTAARTLTLPAAASCTGRSFQVLKTTAAAFAVTLDGDASETINGSATFAGVDAQWDTVTITSDGSNWVITAKAIA